MGFNLRKSCEAMVLGWLLPRLVTKKCCSRIPMSGEEAKMVNCYVIYIRTKEGELLYMVSGIDTGKSELSVNSINPKDKTFSVPGTLPLSNISTEQISINHYYKGSSVYYNSIFDLFFKYVTIANHK